MSINIADIAKKRYTCKVYEKGAVIPQEKVAQLLDVLRFSPSSVNSQPWHFIIVSTDEGKERILPGISEFNHPRITDASHVVIFCAKNEMDDAHIQGVLAHEAEDNRFATDEMKEANDNGRRYFIGLNNHSQEALHQWEGKQIYIALGQLLLAAAALGIDSTPIEGFDPAKLDEILNLKEMGYHSVVVASLGYRSDDDFNAKLKKSRFPKEQLFTYL